MWWLVTLVHPSSGVYNNINIPNALYNELFIVWCAYFQEEAMEAITQITIGGVTNMGAGLCAAIDQFKTHFRKRYTLLRQCKNIIFHYVMYFLHNIL